MNDNHTDNPNNITELPLPSTPSPHQLLAKCLRLVETQNIEEAIVILVDAEGNMDKLHSGLTLERALYYISLTQQSIIDEARGIIE